jgi:hypothetical protein
MPTLRDLESEPFESVPASGPPAVGSDEWVVLTGEAGPVSVLPPGTVLADDARPPCILVAAADLDQGEAYDSAAFAQFADADALVLTEPAAAPDGEPSVVGLVSGLTLARFMLRGPVRGNVLPGPPTIPLIARSCGYLESGVTCATPVSFVFRPSVMPDCPNRRSLAVHLFAW